VKILGIFCKGSEPTFAMSLEFKEKKKDEQEFLSSSINFDFPEIGIALKSSEQFCI